MDRMSEHLAARQAGRLAPYEEDKSELFQVGRNCWRIVEARAGRFLVDGEAYFADLGRALGGAKRQILIIGWDFDSRIHLSPGKGEPARALGQLLNELAEKNLDLQVYILVWDCVPFYALNREPLPSLTYAPRTHPRVAYEMDDHHPVASSHHQKIVVIDDRIAYCGGFDLTSCRWDSPGHPSHDSRRVNPAGESYDPFHDIQLRVEGEAAAALGELARRRWRYATGSDIPVPGPVARDAATPASQPGCFVAARVAIARTEPAYLGHPEIREIEAHYCDLIRRAHRYIYIENQYFACRTVAAALIESLQRKQGPEIIVVLPSSHEGWLEERTMGAMRNKYIAELYQQDRYKRLGIFLPGIRGLTCGLKIHSKLMIVDDRYALVGSANLNHRSMGLDTECNLVLDGTSHPSAREAIRTLFCQLLAEHLGVRSDLLMSRPELLASPLRFIRTRRRGRRRLVGYHSSPSDWMREVLVDLEIVDPRGTLEAEREFDSMLSALRATHFRPLGILCLLGGLVLGLLELSQVVGYGLFTFWEFLPTFREGLGTLTGTAIAHPIHLAWAWLLAPFLFIPVNLQILVTASLLGLLPAIIVSLAGGALHALIGYSLGRLIGVGRLERWAFANVDYVTQRFAGRGILPVVYTRILFWFPFSFVNLAAGAGRIGLRRLILGTILGLMPGTLILTLLQHELMAFLEHPAWFEGLMTILLTLVIVFLTVLLRARYRLLARHNRADL